jgi:hypothetical protein
MRLVLQAASTGSPAAPPEDRFHRSFIKRMLALNINQALTHKKTFLALTPAILLPIIDPCCCKY